MNNTSRVFTRVLTGFSLIFAALAATTSSVMAELLAYYEFDDVNNTFADSSGNGTDITGTAGTDPLWGATTGFNSSGAYDFSGDRLIVPIDVNASVMPAMTWGAWVRTDDINTGLRKVLGQDNGAWDRTIGLDNRINSGAAVTFRYTAFTGTTDAGPVEGGPAPLNTTDWAFIAASHDQANTAITLYVDLDASTTGDALVEITENNASFGPGWPTFAIGGIRPDLPNEAWDGAIDQVFVYNEALVPAKVTAIRNRGRREILGIPDSDPDIQLNPLALFGDLRGQGAGPKSAILTLSNIGLTQALNLSSIGFTGVDSARYSVTPPVPNTIPPQTSIEIEVNLNPPDSGGLAIAEMFVSSDDVDTPLATVDVTANVDSDPNLSLMSGGPIFGRMSFDALPLSIQRTVTLNNTGVVNTLTINPPTISGIDSPNYSIASFPTELPPGGEADIVVALAPGATGNYSALLEITTSDPDSGPISLSLDARVLLVGPADLLAFYPFDDAANPLSDESGNTGDATIGVGAPAYQAADGFQDGYYQFTGADQLIIPLDINPTAIPELTMGAWVRVDDLAPVLSKVMGHDNGAWDRTLGLDNREGGFRYTAFTGTNNNGPVAGTPSPVSTEDWTFLAAAYDETNSEVTVYVDLDASTTDEPVISVSEPTLMMDGWPTMALGGIRPDVLSEPWIGCIDNAFIYEGILSDAGIANLRNLGRTAILGPDNFRITGIVRNPDNTVTLTWNSDPTPGTTYRVLFNFDVAAPLSEWPDDDDSVLTGGETTTHTSVNMFTQPRVFFVVARN